MQPIRSARNFLLFAGSLLLATPAWSVDGVIEINDASVVAAGGYPYIISASGSYVLTGNLTPPTGVSALVINENDVEIDLNGFALIAGLPTAAGVYGVDNASGYWNLSVRNGTIRLFGGAGINSPFNQNGPRVQNVTFRNNEIGIDAVDCVIVESLFYNNTDRGIRANGCKIENNVVRNSEGSGIDARNSVIVHNTIQENGAIDGGGGILAVGSTINENVLVGNYGFGVSDTLGAPPGPVPAPPGVPFVPPVLGPIPSMPSNVITKNVVDGVFAGPGIGIYTNSSALIDDNTVSNWTYDGIVCGIACSLKGNKVHSNNISAGGNGGVTVGHGSTVTANSITHNLGVGLLIAPTANWSNNTLNANTVQDMSLIAGPGPGAHPTSGLMNLCSGALGPVPGAGPGTCP